MAVLDLLPHAVSGVYFLYHQDFEAYAFGKISALREAALAREQKYQYYYSKSHCTFHHFYYSTLFAWEF
jgi:arginyl-tRNA--protein-N-Asp/Glu arginylyltransferase